MCPNSAQSLATQLVSWTFQRALPYSSGARSSRPERRLQSLQRPVLLFNIACRIVKRTVSVCGLRQLLPAALTKSAMAGGNDSSVWVGRCDVEGL